MTDATLTEATLTGATQTGPPVTSESVANAFMPHLPDPGYSPRHREVLAAAMDLVAERGLGAASLRQLARRLSMSQPSLYHYFDSKDELVEQIIADYTASLLRESVANVPPQPVSLGALVRLLVSRTLHIWRRPKHAAFVRFMFAVTMDKPEHGEVFRRHLLDRAADICAPWLEHLARHGEIRAEDTRHVVDLCMGALHMRFIKRRVLCGQAEDAEECHAFAEFLADVVTRGASARARDPRPADLNPADLNPADLNPERQGDPEDVG